MNKSLRSVWLAALLLTATCGWCAVSPSAPDFQALVASPDRSEADRATDARRKPAQMLAFYGVRPGMMAFDVSAGGGYNTELLARAVGASGKVYAQNPAVAPRLDERMKAPFMSNVVAVVREFSEPVPPELRNLDLVTFNFNYHDITYMSVDRARMNRSIFNALKPGGTYIIADHSAQAGAGASVAKSLHRIEETTVRSEVEAAGFRFVAEGGFLRNPGDARTAPVFKPDQPNDEFILKFVKP